MYNVTLKRRYKDPVDSVILPFLEKHAPRRNPAKLVWTDEDGQRIEIPYRTVPPWEVPSEIAFEPGCEPLPDWIPWMKDGLAASCAPMYGQTCRIPADNRPLPPPHLIWWKAEIARRHRLAGRADWRSCWFPWG